MSHENDASHAIFRSSSEDGTRLLFVIQSDEQWAITRNDERVAVGATSPAAFSSGVQKFLSMAAAGKRPYRAVAAT